MINQNRQEVPNFLMDTEEGMIYETSFVEDPATGLDFLKFKKEDVKNLEFKQLEKEGYQRMVSGVWFMPDTKYLRYDKERGIYTVEFKKDDLKNALLKYLKSDYANNIKVEHQGEFLDGFVSIEHWIYNGKDTKSPVFNLSIEDLGYKEEEIKEGTVFKTVFVEDEQFWNEQVMTGAVKGFSIGGLFSLEEESNAVRSYFNNEVPTEVIVEPSVTVEETVVVEEVKVEDSTDAKSAGVALDERVVVGGEQPTIQTQPDFSAILERLTQLEGQLKNYSEENSLLKQSLESKEKEVASISSKLKEKDEVIDKQASHLKEAPIKSNYSPSKSQDSVYNPNTPTRTKVIGGIEIPY